MSTEPIALDLVAEHIEMCELAVEGGDSDIVEVHVSGLLADLTALVAEVQRLRALTTVGDDMVERALAPWFPGGYDPAHDQGWHREQMREALTAALSQTNKEDDHA